MIFIASKNSMDVTRFNITAHTEPFQNHNIELDPFFYQPSINKLLALFIHINKIFPVILHKSDFATKPKPVAIASKKEWDELVASMPWFPKSGN